MDLGGESAGQPGMATLCPLAWHFASVCQAGAVPQILIVRLRCKRNAMRGGRSRSFVTERDKLSRIETSGEGGGGGRAVLSGERWAKAARPSRGRGRLGYVLCICNGMRAWAAACRAHLGPITGMGIMGQDWQPAAVRRSDSEPAPCTV